ncbi:hypothetical protein KFU94_14685 [Chloroflexi bacterium TSY]|nr:hypothetical protein [Chloroflexi bacterium TSY]
MISLGTLGLTGALVYGGVKALRSLIVRKERRGEWLNTTSPAGATATPEPAGTATVIEPIDRPASLLNYIVHDEQGRKQSILALSGTTTALHILLGLQWGTPIFIWNGAGFVAFAVAQYFVPQLAPYRREIRDGFIAYTGTTIVAYFLVRGPAGLTNVVGMTTKLVEAGLIALLWREEEDE